MSQYVGIVEGITPSLTSDNFTLDATSGESCRVVEAGWSGEVTTSTVVRTKVNRSSGAAGAGTAGNVSKKHPNALANRVDFFTVYATTQPTPNAGSLVPVGAWNAHGGVVRYYMDRADQIILIGAATLSCRNGTGTPQSTYGCVFEED